MLENTFILYCIMLENTFILYCIMLENTFILYCIMIENLYTRSITVIACILGLFAITAYILGQYILGQ